MDQLVPQDHLVRKQSQLLIFHIYLLVKDLYSEVGRPSIDPIVLFIMVFIQYIFGIRSMRQTIKEIETNVAYRWFLGFGFYTEVPHFSTFGKNYKRRYHESIFKKQDYVYDEYFDCYLCPQGQPLKYTTTTKEGYRQYKSNPVFVQIVHFYPNVQKVKITKN